jgi:hypothetical protein
VIPGQVKKPVIVITLKSVASALLHNMVNNGPDANKNEKNHQILI